MVSKAYGKPADESQYLKTNRLIKVLRFLNLMEPGRNVMSISKVYFVMNMWVFFFILVWIALFDRTHLVPVMAQGAHTTLALFNYMYRRHTMNENGHLAADQPNPAAPEPPVDPAA